MIRKYTFSNRQLNALLLALSMSFIFLLSACGDDEPAPPEDSVVGFSETSGSVSEAGATTSITISITEAAVQAGTISVNIAGDLEYGTDYTTTPEGSNGVIIVPIAEGASTASVTVATIDNDDPAVSEDLTFTISGVTDGLSVGTNSSFTLTVENDDSGISSSLGMDTLYLGEVQVGLASEIMSYDITGVELSGDITVTGTELFTVAKSETGMFSESITLTSDDLTGNQASVYVMFSPTLVTGDTTEYITHSTPNAEDVSVAVRGNGVQRQYVVWAEDFEDIDYTAEWMHGNTSSNDGFDGDILDFSSIVDGELVLKNDTANFFSVAVDISSFISEQCWPDATGFQYRLQYDLRFEGDIETNTDGNGAYRTLNTVLTRDGSEGGGFWGFSTRGSADGIVTGSNNDPVNIGEVGQVIMKDNFKKLEPTLFNEAILHFKVFGGSGADAVIIDNIRLTTTLEPLADNCEFND